MTEQPNTEDGSEDSQSYFSNNPGRTHVPSFHAAALLERDVREIGVHEAGVTRHLSHVYGPEDAAPVKFDIVYKDVDPVVSLLEDSEVVEEIDVIERSMTISVTIDAR